MDRLKFYSELSLLAKRFLVGDIDDPQLERDELAKLLTNRYDLWQEFKEIYVDGPNLTDHELDGLRREIETQVPKSIGREQPSNGEKYEEKLSMETGYANMRNFVERQICEEWGNRRPHGQNDPKSTNSMGSLEGIGFERVVPKLKYNELERNILSSSNGFTRAPDFGGNLKNGIGQEWTFDETAIPQTTAEYVMSRLSIQQQTESTSGYNESFAPQDAIPMPGFPHNI
jgi:hypothetical protein